MHPEFAAGLARRLDETHLQYDLLRLKNLHRVYDVGGELAGDDNRFVKRHRVGRGAGEHDPPVHRGYPQAAAGDAVELKGEPRDVV